MKLNEAKAQLAKANGAKQLTLSHIASTSQKHHLTPGPFVFSVSQIWAKLPAQKRYLVLFQWMNEKWIIPLKENISKVEDKDHWTGN